MAHRRHERGEDVAAAGRGLLQPCDSGRCLVLVPPLEVAQARDLALLFGFGRAAQFDGAGLRRALGIAEGVDAHDRQPAVVLEGFVGQRFVLDLAALMDAVRVCSLGQITDALFEVGGQYRRNM